MKPPHGQPLVVYTINSAKLKNVYIKTNQVVPTLKTNC